MRSPRPDLCSGPRSPARGDTCALGARPSLPGASRASTPGQQRVRASARPGPAGAALSRQLSPLPSAAAPLVPAAGPRSGKPAEGSGPAGTHRALCRRRRRRRARLPTVPRAGLHLDAERRLLGARPAPGSNASSGSPSRRPWSRRRDAPETRAAGTGPSLVSGAVPLCVPGTEISSVGLAGGEEYSD